MKDAETRCESLREDVRKLRDKNESLRKNLEISHSRLTSQSHAIRQTRIRSGRDDHKDELDDLKSPQSTGDDHDSNSDESIRTDDDNNDNDNDIINNEHEVERGEEQSSKQEQSENPPLFVRARTHVNVLDTEVNENLEDLYFDDDERDDDINEDQMRVNEVDLERHFSNLNETLNEKFNKLAKSDETMNSMNEQMKELKE